MKHILILITDQNIDLTTLTGTIEIFNRSNDYLNSLGKPNAFKTELVGEKSSFKTTSNGFEIHIDKLIDEVKTPDLIIIPSINNPHKFSGINKNIEHWIRDCYAKGTEVASLCVGAFILAATGLLDGKKCSTHWMLSNEFQKMFPKVKLSQHTIITDERGLYTSGGAYSYLNLILYLLEKYEGRHLALWAAKMFGIELNRENQSQFIVFQGQKRHEDNEILKVQEFIESNYEDKILVSELEKMTNMGSRSFIRRFKSATYNTPLEYIQRVKIEAAKRFLEMSNMNISDIKYSLSWVDDKSFRNIFKKHTGHTPVAYRQKYSKNKT